MCLSSTSPPLWHDLQSDASWQGVELASPAGDPTAVSRARLGDEISFLSFPTFHSGVDTESTAVVIHSAAVYLTLRLDDCFADTCT